MAYNKVDFRKRKSFRFLFLGLTELEYSVSRILDIHQQSYFASSIKEAFGELANNYDIFVVNEAYLKDKNSLKILKCYTKNSINIALYIDKKPSKKHSFINSYLKLDHRLFTKLMLATVTAILKKSEVNKNLGSLIKEACKYEMLGSDQSINKLRELILNLKDIGSNVMITGESGTGKELIARMLNKSDANTGPFVAVNCSSIPETLVESELFGYKKGAFTGAMIDKKGLIEQANGGDLFLDEIGDLPLPLQAKVLRVLQDGEFFKVGSSVAIQSNFRLISATNKNLEGMVGSGQFRKDLYYRINVIRIRTNPLRHRMCDITDLFKFFSLLQFNELGLSNSNIFLTESALQKLAWYSWEGNVRELKNVVERSLIRTKLSDIKFLDIQDIDLQELGFMDQGINLPHKISDISPSGYKAFLRQAQKLYYDNALRIVEGNVGDLADKIGVGRSTVFRHVKRLNARNKGLRF